jgi:hypothetical protein
VLGNKLRTGNHTCAERNGVVGGQVVETERPHRGPLGRAV